MAPGYHPQEFFQSKGLQSQQANLGMHHPYLDNLIFFLTVHHELTIH